MDISEIGLIYNMANPEEPVALEGWHVNTLQPIDGAEEFLIVVNSPSHGFFGVPNESVYHYKFSSKEQAQMFLNTEEVV
jgi:hypothetical protein